MPKFKVTSTIKRDGEYYEPGDVIELPKKDAAAMPYSVEAIEAEKPEPKGGDGEKDKPPKDK